MTKRSREPRAKAVDPKVELASPPCLINEVDPAYMGLDDPPDRQVERKSGDKPAVTKQR